MNVWGKIYSVSILILVFIGCKKEQSIPCALGAISYYSDYFVFVSDEGSEPLVIPIDVNWRPGEDVYEEEFKGWYGTEEEWPIAYHVLERPLENCMIPQETWEHLDNEFYKFNKSNRTINLQLTDQPGIKLYIPESEEWILMPFESERKHIYAMRSLVEVDGVSKTGWMIYERIRRTNGELSGNLDFKTFFWIPIIVDNAFYHFEQHGDFQTATKWYLEDQLIVVDTSHSFTLDIDSTSTDEFSGRNNIPEIIQILASKWNLEIILESSGSQIGYGPEFPNGLAYYRQSLIQSTEGSSRSGYGMLELIIEND